MKDGLRLPWEKAVKESAQEQRPPPGKQWADLAYRGNCVICHTAIYSWERSDPATHCGMDCEHPDDLCQDPECYEARRKFYQGSRKLKHPCDFPRLRNKLEG